MIRELMWQIKERLLGALLLVVDIAKLAWAVLVLAWFTYGPSGRS